MDIVDIDLRPLLAKARALTLEIGDIRGSRLAVKPEPEDVYLHNPS
jgi:hypothetical protein